MASPQPPVQSMAPSASADSTTDPKTNLFLLALPLAIPLILLSLYPSQALRWFQKKRYQYEVTYSLYMMTPTEKFIFNSILFLFLALVSIAATLYLPSSISNLLRRGWYYLLGDTPDSYTHSLKEMVERGFGVAADTLFGGAITTTTTQGIVGAGKETARRVAEAAVESLSKGAEAAVESAGSVAGGALGGDV